MRRIIHKDILIHGLSDLRICPFATFAIALSLSLTVVALLLFAPHLLFTLRFTQQAQIMFRVLLKVLCRNPVVAELRVASQLIVFLNHLLRGAAHLALGAAAVKDAVDDITAALLLPVAVLLTNMDTCLNGDIISRHTGVKPPSLEDYMAGGV